MKINRSANKMHMYIGNRDRLGKRY